MQLSDEEIEEKIQEAKKYDEEDKKNVEIVHARIALQNLCYDHKKNANDKQKIIIDEVLKWIRDNKDNKDLTINEYDQQKKKLLDVMK